MFKQARRMKKNVQSGVAVGLPDFDGTEHLTCTLSSAIVERLRGTGTCLPLAYLVYNPSFCMFYHVSPITIYAFSRDLK